MGMGRTKKQKEADWEITAGAIVVVLLWLLTDIDRRIVAIASFVLAVLILFRMPTRCCAERSRGGQCEKPTLGVFFSCGEPAHEDRKRDLVRTSAYWSGLARGHYSGRRGRRTIYLASAAATSALFAFAVWIIT
jgi:hypothetical protein